MNNENYKTVNREVSKSFRFTIVVISLAVVAAFFWINLRNKSASKNFGPIEVPTFVLIEQLNDRGTVITNWMISEKSLHGIRDGYVYFRWTNGCISWISSPFRVTQGITE